MKEYKRCTKCVMDNVADDTITFDANGVCNYYNEAVSSIGKVYFPNEEGEHRLNDLIDKLKKDGEGKDYDCLMGISGGLDSSYLAYLGAVKWGLRILAVHVDDGFDTDLAKSNIASLCKACKIDLKTIAPDAEQFNDLTRAYFLAEVPNVAVPQDNILFACLYKYAKKYGVKYFLSGGNFALECILQRGNTYTCYDVVNIKAIHKQFGRKPMNKLPFLSQTGRDLDSYIYCIKSLRPLNYIDYNRERAINELKDFCGFTYYDAKHLENTLTKVIQLYWFYHKFGVDKRKSHLSSMIASGQMTREEALKELEKPMYDKVQMEKDLQDVLSKLELDRTVFDELVNRPGKQHSEYATDKLNPFLHKLKRLF